MSSGAYIVAVPVALIGMVVGGAAVAVGAVGVAGVAAADALGNVGERALSAADAAAMAAASARERRKELDAMRENLDAEYLRVRESAEAVLSDLAAFRDSLRATNFQYSPETATFTGREAGISTEVASTLNLDDLMFMEVNVRTAEVTYVVLDFSELASLRNARNSAQFRKMALASDLMKKVMFWVPDNPQDQMRLNQLIGVVNGMLDDDSVSFSHFRQFVETRFAAFQRLQEQLDYDPELWDQYCALCAMSGKRPRRIKKEALAQEVRRMTEEAVAERFVRNARTAFMETVRELGLEVRSGHVLDRVPGTLLVDRENPGFNLFFSQYDTSFLVEMVDTEEAAPAERKTQHDAVCRKRHQLEQLMLAKGYRLQVLAENDSMDAQMMGVEEKKDGSQSRAEQLRRRRALAGKTPKLKMAGGK